MVDHIDILRTCPAKAWAQHRFTSEMQLVNGNKIVIRYDVPMDASTAVASLYTKDMVAERFGSLLGEVVLDEDVLSAIADALNTKMTITYRVVTLHLRLVAECLMALADEQYMVAFLMLRALRTELQEYATELWLYEWSEWLSLVDQYIRERANPTTLKIIEKMS